MGSVLTDEMRAGSEWLQDWKNKEDRKKCTTLGNRQESVGVGGKSIELHEQQQINDPQWCGREQWCTALEINKTAGRFEDYI